ncbi:MAG: hypothetical protein AAFO75_09800, partial [Pseudomonadota bacterium]
WHAAGLVGQLRSNANVTQLLGYSVDLYRRLEAEIGLATGWPQHGHALPHLRPSVNNRRGMIITAIRENSLSHKSGDIIALVRLWGNNANQQPGNEEVLTNKPRHA